MKPSRSSRLKMRVNFADPARLSAGKAGAE
jgi:hypothetical protein